MQGEGPTSPSEGISPKIDFTNVKLRSKFQDDDTGAFDIFEIGLFCRNSVIGQSTQQGNDSIILTFTNPTTTITLFEDGIVVVSAANEVIALAALTRLVKIIEKVIGHDFTQSTRRIAIDHVEITLRTDKETAVDLARVKTLAELTDDESRYTLSIDNNVLYFLLRNSYEELGDLSFDNKKHIASIDTKGTVTLYGGNSSVEYEAHTISDVVQLWRSKLKPTVTMLNNYIE